MNSVKKIGKKPLKKNIKINAAKCASTIIEKYILGALVKCRDEFYLMDLNQKKEEFITKEKNSNFKSNYIINEILNNPICPKEIKDLNCTVLFLTKGGGYQFWGNYKNFISVSFGDDTALILLN